MFQTQSGVEEVVMTTQFLPIIALIAWAVFPPITTAAHDSTKATFFRERIQPALQKHCYQCHSTRADSVEGGLLLDKSAGLRQGGESGVVIVPGDPDQSLLMSALKHDGLKMPPKKKLPQNILADFETWIRSGAVDPRSDSEDTGRHWAFEPIKYPDPPHVDSAWPRNEIDQFILSRLDQEGIKPSPEAEPATLLRRLYLDLTGLPPLPSDVARLLNSSGVPAWENTVDRLLQSPHYGERWARYWLDMARYADSNGYESDRVRPHAWRWRDWVINALNNDLPFDQFTIDQIAGDLLPNASKDQKIATGFHRNTLVNTEGGVDREEDRVKRTVDRTNTVAKVWLGLTLECCQCHSHKYDRISQEEYYEFYAFFNNLLEPLIPVPTKQDLEQYRTRRTAFETEHQPYLDAIRQYRSAKMANWLDSLPADEANADIAHIIQKPAEKRDGADVRHLVHFYGYSEPLLDRLIADEEQHRNQAPVPPEQTELARAVEESIERRETRIHLRGDFLTKGDSVTSGTPSLLPPLTTQNETADRRDLAEWIVSENNPLTSRVIVNRVWQQYFGRGLVTSDADFGTQGTPPSHPELLDWLATRFRQNGWSLKKLHRLIVTSATYRQSSHMRNELLERDPYNTLLARQNRLRVEAEIVRDLALSASGLFNGTIGGKSVRPPQPADVALLGFQGRVTWPVSEGPDRYRRGLYTFFQRTVPYPMLVDFDVGDSNSSCTHRERSTSPLQALTLWNDPVFVECAQALGRRITTDLPAAGTGARLQHAVRLTMSREPSPAELETLSEYFAKQQARFMSSPEMANSMIGDGTDTVGSTQTELAAWISIARLLINLDEFITRE